MAKINWVRYNELLRELEYSNTLKIQSDTSYDLKKLAKYMKENNKKYSQLSKEELNKFKI